MEEIKGTDHDGKARQKSTRDTIVQMNCLPRFVGPLCQDGKHVAEVSVMELLMEENESSANFSFCSLPMDNKTCY